MVETIRIAIIGGGATGALAALHLARALPDRKELAYNKPQMVRPVSPNLCIAHP